MKKILVYLSLTIMIINWLFFGLISNVNAVWISDMLWGSVNSTNFLWLHQSSYKLKRDYIFGNWLFMALPAWFGKIDIYIIKNYDWVNKKWIVQYITSVKWDDVKKLGDRFNSLAFSAKISNGSIIYSFENNWNSWWQIRTVGTINDVNAIPMEFKDNIILIKKSGVLKKSEVCAGQTKCLEFQQNNPNLVNNLVCDTSSPYEDRNPTCYLVYKWDKIYAYSIKDITKEFQLNNTDDNTQNINLNYDGLYTWSNYSQYYDVNHPIKINGMFLYNTDRIGSIKYYNIFTNVNWHSGTGDKTQDQIVMSTIKVYPDAQLSLDELATGNSLSWNIVWSGNVRDYKVYMFK